MDSLNARITIAMNGRAKGISTNANANTPIRIGAALSTALASTSSGAAKADSAYGIGYTRTLTSSASEELDLFSFTSVLGESGASMTKCRLFYIIHLAGSSSSGITLGNGSANQFNPFSMGTTTTLTLAPGEFIIFGSPTTSGITISNTVKTLKVLNDDGSNSATYEIGTIGEA